MLEQKKPRKSNSDLNAQEYFTDDRLEVLDAAIKAAEKNTSGEIRLYVENTCQEDVLDRAAFLFEELKMHRTELRNGVLFYLTMKDRKFAILGDAGINAKVGNEFWDHIKMEMIRSFKQGEITEGLGKGIRMAGEALATHFPYRKGDINELSDEIIIK